MTREIHWDPRARKDLAGLDRVVAERVHSGVARLAEGVGDVRRLSGIEPPLHRLRVGAWRVLFRIDAETIIVLRVLPRDKAYR